MGSTAADVKLGRREAIAICGMSLRLAGDLCTPEQYWSALSEAKDMVEPVPPSRYNISAFTDGLGCKGSIKPTKGYFLSTKKLGHLDTSIFQISKDELAKCDPQQRLVLETAYEALENAGETDFAGRHIGCYIGTSAEDWLRMAAKEPHHTQGHVLGGSTDFMLANRISYQFDLKGPSYAIKTGCSASLIALHAACTALQDGDIESALVVGTSLQLDPTMTMLMTSDGIISPTGSCNTFDAKADGFARADGIAVLYIRLLADAEQRGSPIRAVIRASGTNVDGRGESGTSITEPNGQAHKELMRKTYAQADLDPHGTAFVECHGTGTPVGDPVEANAIGEVFGQGNPGGIYIGSVKPNVGHTEAASGVVSTIKAVLALENSMIPPNIKFEQPNPDIRFADFGLKVPTSLTPFPPDRAKRVSVNSFGVGGSNAHVILEAYENHSVQNGLGSPGPQLLLLTASTKASLQSTITSVQTLVQKNPSSAADVAYTLARHRQKMRYRAFGLWMDSETEGLVNISSQPEATMTAPNITMIFTGQGAQWPGFGADLVRHDKHFRDDLSRMNHILQSLKYPPRWNIIEEIEKSAESSLVHKAEISQPLCTALQIALVNRFAAAGVRPQAVIGHSSGEIAAAYTVNVLSLEAALVLAYYRGYAMTTAEASSQSGAMGVVSQGSRLVAGFLRPGVVVACENSPASTTISGDRKAVVEVLEAIKAEMPDAECRTLKVDVAYHSHHMLAVGDEYARLVREEMSHRNWAPEVVQTLGLVEVVSSVTGEKLTAPGDIQNPDYWQKNLVSPVRFATSVKALLDAHTEEEGGVFLEVGPHSTLAGPLRQNCTAGGRRCDYIASLIRGQDSYVSLLSAFGNLFTRGVPLNFENLFPKGHALSTLPSYSWDHSGDTQWYESRVSKEWRFRKYPVHCLLGGRVLESSDLQPSWRNVLYLENELWLADHKVRQDVVFPLVGYVAMAGEAVRQTADADVSSGYSVRSFIVHTALVLPSSSGVEVLTALRRHKLSDTEESRWFDFSICSHNGTGWTKHCEGQVRCNKEHTKYPSVWGVGGHADTATPLLPRKVNERRWYEALAKTGIIYGPEFQLLRNVRSATQTYDATGEIQMPVDEWATWFALHPVVLDSCFQAVFVAFAHGLSRNFDRILMPTKIQEINVAGCWGTTDGSAQVRASGDERDCSVECTMGDRRVILQIKSAQFTRLDDNAVEEDDEAEEEKRTDPHAAARLHWLPDIDFVDQRSLVLPPKAPDREQAVMLEEMTLLCILDSAQRVRDLKPHEDFLEMYKSWLLREVARAKAGDQFPLIERPESVLALGPDQRQDRIKCLYDVLTKAEAMSPLAISVKRIHDHAAEIITGSCQVLDLLMGDNMLANLYSQLSFDYGPLAQLLSHANPALRILEVGAGTGATTELVLRPLLENSQSSGLPGYSQYTFTDVSAGFFAQAKERFSYASNMDYKVLDVSKDALYQGFEPTSYDLIVAANVLHTTPSLEQTLRNLQPVLKPGGRLIITELCCVKRSPGFIFGTLPGWWMGIRDDREWEPFVSVERWGEELQKACFTGVDTVVYDESAPYNFSASIMARRIEDNTSCRTEDGNRRRSVTILSGAAQHSPARELIASLTRNSWSVSVVGLDDEIPRDQDIICMLDMESSFFESLTEHGFKRYQHFIRNAQLEQKILWLSRPVQVDCVDPRSAQGIGAAKTARSELGISMCTLEVDPSEPRFSELVESALLKIRRDQDDDVTGRLNADNEFAVIGGVLCTGRYHPFNLRNELIVTSASPTTPQNTRKTLKITRSGLIDSLQWFEEPIMMGRDDMDMEDDAVEIEPCYVGLNFRDVMITSGLLSNLPGESGRAAAGLGAECAGTVTRVGSRVKAFAVGDAVMALTTGGCLTTRAVLSETLVCKVPSGMSFEQAACLPASYVTVIRALCEVGDLQKGQSVLIHSACGGVGLAAVQLSQYLGATVYATVGTEEKVKYLAETFDIPRHRIFHSRNDSFLDGIMRETDGRGVDLVLNSLAGELLHTSWNCVAPFGTLVELGKRDIAGAAQLDMQPFLANRGYSCVDIAQIVRERPAIIQRILRRVMACFEDGIFFPLPESARKVFASTETREALQYFQQGRHLGKILVQFGAETPRLDATPSYRPLSFRTDASYLLAGGMGGLGRSVAIWLAERGAGALTILSRSAGLTKESEQLRVELESLGCAVTMVAGRADNAKDVKRAIRESTFRVKGVFQLAMVLKDAPLVDMKWSEWTSVIQPKVQGTYNLHKELQDYTLDFFWMASSLVTVIDQVGQGNYSAANTFLEAFVQYRHKLGLPASILNISPIDGVGYVAENAHARRSITLQGMGFSSESTFLDALELSLLRSAPPNPATGGMAPAERLTSKPPRSWSNPSQVVMGLRSETDLEDASARTNWRLNRRMGFYHNRRRGKGGNNKEGGETGEDHALKAFCSRAAQDPSILESDNGSSFAFMDLQVLRKIIDLTMRPDDTGVDSKVSLAQLGVDSLMAVELRRWCRSVFALQISVLEIMQAGTVRQLSKVVLHKLKEKYSKCLE